MQQAKQAYSAPTLKDWGSVTDMTLVGNTNPGGDSMCGSITHSSEQTPFKCVL